MLSPMATDHDYDKKAASDKTGTIQTHARGDKSYAFHLASSLNRIRNDETFCDVTIVIDNQRFPAHRAVLCASSNYFKGMFSSGFQEGNSSEITISEGSAECFEQMLDFAYTGHFQLSADNVCDVLRMACYMDFTHAVSVCIDFAVEMRKDVTLDDLFEMFYLTDSQYPVSKSADELSKYLVKNFVKLTGCQTFLDHASKSFVDKCLSSKEVETEIADEEVILQCSVKWLRHDWERRQPYAASILSKVRLGLISTDKLEEILGDDLLAIPRCKKMVEMINNIRHGSLASPQCVCGPQYQRVMQFFISRNTIDAPVFIEEQAEHVSLHVRINNSCYKIPNTNMRPIIYPRNRAVLDEHGNGLSLISAGRNNVYLAGGLIDDRWEGDHGVYLNGQRIYRPPTPQHGFYRFDMKRQRWLRLPGMPVALIYPALAYAGGYIYAMGSSSQSCLNCQNVLRYKLSTAQWEEISPMPYDLKDMSTITTGDHIFVAGSCFKPGAEISLYVLALNYKTCSWSIAYEAHVPIMHSYPQYVRDIASGLRYLRQYPIKIFVFNGLYYFQSIKYEDDRFRVKVEEIVWCEARNGNGVDPIITLVEEVDQEVIFGAKLENEDVPCQTQMLKLDTHKVKLAKMERCRLSHNRSEPFEKAMMMW